MYESFKLDLHHGPCPWTALGCRLKPVRPYLWNPGSAPGFKNATKIVTPRPTSLPVCRGHNPPTTHPQG